jgi:organic hydroperoxide reductase OsmC/OhrA
MLKFPLEYEVFAEFDSNLSSYGKGQTSKESPIACTIPVEFGGPGGGYTPEDLFALSIMHCIISSFKCYCHKAHQTFKSIKGKSVLKMNVDSNNKLFFTGIDIFLEVCEPSNEEKVKKLLEEAVNNCPVSNSIKIAKKLHISMK